MENHESNEIISNPEAPYIRSLAAQYGRAANYHAVTHPSLPNYLALTAGDTFSITQDCADCFINSDSIATQIEAAGRSWKAYMESMPRPCFIGNEGTLYMQKHNPFIYFDDIRNNPDRCKNIVPFTEFENDLLFNAVPDFVWISPNQCNDMHNCPVGTGDAWLQRWVPQILDSAAWKDKGVLFIVFDEGTSNAGCCQYAHGGRVEALVISPLGSSHFQSDIAYDHYSLLRTIEESWKLPLLNKAGCPCSAPMTDFFRGP